MTLHYVDPHTPHGRRYRAIERFGCSRAGQVFSRHVLSRIDPWLYRVTGGRYPRALGTTATAPLLCVGAKSGRPRLRQLAYFHDGPDPILIASNWAGPKHPGWYYNLKAHPECRLGGQWFSAAEVTDPEEYVRLYDLAEQVYAGYADYRAQTRSAGRRIPVFQLSAIPGEPRAGAESHV